MKINPASPKYYLALTEVLTLGYALVSPYLRVYAYDGLVLRGVVASSRKHAMTHATFTKGPVLMINCSRPKHLFLLRHTVFLSL